MSIAAETPGAALSSGMALHRQIYLVLKDEISRGVYAAGMLPNEEGLCERFGVSRITVRRALADLASGGMVERKHGRGTYVLWEPSRAASSLSLELIDTLRTSDMASWPVRVGLARMEPPQEVRLHLKLAAAENVAIRAQRIRTNRKGDASYLTDTWIPVGLGKRVTESALKKRAVYEILAENGVAFGRVVQEFGATVCDPGKAELLGVEIGSPLLKVSRLMHDDGGQPVLLLSSYLPADRGIILMETDGAAINTLGAGQVVLDLPERTGSAGGG